MFKSVAKWPQSVNLANSENISDDSHATLTSARIICDKLRKNGFGGDGKIFPIETWVEDENGNKIDPYGSLLEYEERRPKTQADLDKLAAAQAKRERKNKNRK